MDTNVEIKIISNDKGGELDCSIAYDDLDVAIDRVINSKLISNKSKIELIKSIIVDETEKQVEQIVVQNFVDIESFTDIYTERFKQALKCIMP